MKNASGNKKKRKTSVGSVTDVVASQQTKSKPKRRPSASSVNSSTSNESDKGKDGESKKVKTINAKKKTGSKVGDNVKMGVVGSGGGVNNAGSASAFPNGPVRGKLFPSKTFNQSDFPYIEDDEVE